jgi:hypothetical protein
MTGTTLTTDDDVESAPPVYPAPPLLTDLTAEDFVGLKPGQTHYTMPDLDGVLRPVLLTLAHPRWSGALKVVRATIAWNALERLTGAARETLTQRIPRLLLHMHSVVVVAPVDELGDWLHRAAAIVAAPANREAFDRASRYPGEQEVA